MAIPIWDDIDVPPDLTLVDVNGLEPESLRLQMQARVLNLWVDEAPDSLEHLVGHDWDDNEGAFAIKDADGVIIGLQIIMDVENA